MTIRPRSGLGSSGQYIISGEPWITGSNLTGNIANNGEQEINFTNVTKSFTVINKTTLPIYVHFDSRANANVINNNHYISLDTTNDSFTFDVRCKKVYVSLGQSTGTGSFELLAEFTGITAIDMYTLTGSGING